MCNHRNYLRTRRKLWQKLIGIKKIYVCQDCGYKMIIR
ncbi:hypothetical protein VPHD81_0002 [Vibrio phage D81]